MQIRWGSVRRAAIAGVALVGLAGAVQASPVAAQDGGSSAAAHACQEGGYSSLVGVQDGQITTFGTTGECVSYAGRGGRLVATSVVQPCLDGGYADLATSEDNTTAFSSEAACVSYAAGGGNVVPVVHPIVVDPRFYMFEAMRFSVSACIVNVFVDGLAPSTTYTFVATFTNSSSSTRSDTSTTDADGRARLFYGADFGTVQTMTVQTYDATGTAIGSPSDVFTIPSGCSSRASF